MCFGKAWKVLRACWPNYYVEKNVALSSLKFSFVLEIIYDKNWTSAFLRKNQRDCIWRRQIAFNFILGNKFCLEGRCTHGSVLELASGIRHARVHPRPTLSRTIKQISSNKLIALRLTNQGQYTNTEQTQVFASWRRENKATDAIQICIPSLSWAPPEHQTTSKCRTCSVLVRGCN